MSINDFDPIDRASSHIDKYVARLREQAGLPNAEAAANQPAFQVDLSSLKSLLPATDIPASKTVASNESIADHLAKLADTVANANRGAEPVELSDGAPTPYEALGRVLDNAARSILAHGQSDHAVRESLLYK